ncbi:MAG TPA: acetate kinase, partial [Candidatus Gracilibacteria bacterium]|nr:acetate kinase [Candidatus Gracilibacteria bacterium]
VQEIWKNYPEIPVYAVFDTAFHQSLSEEVYTYPIPLEYRDQQGIRKYGFHGLAYQSVLRQYQKQFSKIPQRLILCHLGGGCSICAVKDGKSIETSMGFSPLEGLMMTTRGGDIDPGILVYFQDQMRMSSSEISEILNKKSGFQGIANTLNLKQLMERVKQRDEKAVLALKMFTHRLKHYIYAYAGLLGGVDALVFSGGFGFNDPDLINILAPDLEYLGIKIQTPVQFNSQWKQFSDPQSAVSWYGIKVNEEEEICQQVKKALTNNVTHCITKEN